MNECDICGEEKPNVRLFDCYDGNISLGYMFLCPECRKEQNEVGETIPQNQRKKREKYVSQNLHWYR